MTHRVVTSLYLNALTSGARCKVASDMRAIARRFLMYPTMRLKGVE